MLEFEHEFTVTITPNGCVELRIMSHVLQDGQRLSQVANHRQAFEPGDKLPPTIDVPRIGQVSLPDSVRRHADIAWTPERVEERKKRDTANAVAAAAQTGEEVTTPSGIVLPGRRTRTKA
jgi:hypothetical protein